MWPRMRLTCMLACCVAAAFGVFAGTASAGGGLTQTYADPVGDSGTGADIGNITVSYLGRGADVSDRGSEPHRMGERRSRSACSSIPTETS